MNKQETQTLLESLAGQPAPIDGAPAGLEILGSTDARLGYSQLNELLLLFGFDRITHSFFQFLVDGQTEYVPGQAFSSVEQLRDGIDRFRELAVLLYGNVKFAFKTLSRNAEHLSSALQTTLHIEDEAFLSRHAPIIPIKPIAPEDAYLTGYIIERELQNRLENHEDQDAVMLEVRRKEVVAVARENQDAYLASDHLDVYVATSMRERHEFVAVKRLVSQIFGQDTVSRLQLRWFDPTQAYCLDRIDKGLSEALMLRRATCTIYLAQESDTLGKDSELASTLAQGKPVVAFVPEVTEDYFKEHMEGIRLAQSGKSDADLLLSQLRIFEHSAAWSDPIVREWCNAPEKSDMALLRKRVLNQMRAHYDGRARTLRDSHPLGIQVNLETGVACGVLVTRTVAHCAQLIRNILTRRLEFKLEENAAHIMLREQISGCIFRVVTQNDMLTNTFWNFYIDPAE